MLIGGIQGNEPGGFLSADLYADMRLEMGNLIVVPRANFYSIILNKRGAHGDMNRKFTHGENGTSQEDKIVTILKGLISESDYLLNLHDGSGYYHPTYINKWRNPKRFGQSVIADSDEYPVPQTQKVVKLGEMARKVIEEVNTHITHDLYKFHFMNTRTADADSPHREQRRSATYFALTKHHIPAFGVETSKFLPSMDLKVRFHNLVINAFMRLFDIVPESPGLMLDPPALKYLIVTINGRTPVVAMKGQRIEIASGDTLRVTHIESNYERGLSLDILGHGGLNDLRKDFEIFKNTTIIVRKDNQRFAEIPLRIAGRVKTPKAVRLSPVKVDYFVVESMGQRILLEDQDTLHLVKGDKLKILDILPSPSSPSDIKVNFKGFVGDRKNNTGEDRGYTIDTGKNLMRRYSLHKKGKVYVVIATKGKKELARFLVDLSPPKMDYMILGVNSHQHHFLRPEQTVILSRNDEICLEEISTNLYATKGIRLSVNGHSLEHGETAKVKELCATSAGNRHRVDVKKGRMVLGSVTFVVD
ncbi:M14/M99 family metallopeptidase [Thermodesulfobacteriota bacterium]